MKRCPHASTGDVCQVAIMQFLPSSYGSRRFIIIVVLCSVCVGYALSYDFTLIHRSADIVLYHCTCPSPRGGIPRQPVWLRAT